MNSFGAETRWDYDIHVYFDSSNPQSVASAEKLRAMMATELAGPNFRVRELIHRPIGPHPLPMFEANFLEPEFDRTLEWLKKERGAHTVLVHEVTGHDRLDHSEGATWLGDPLRLDYSKFTT